jgi:hypothetical protein
MERSHIMLKPRMYLVTNRLFQKLFLLLFSLCRHWNYTFNSREHHRRSVATSCTYPLGSKPNTSTTCHLAIWCLLSPSHSQSWFKCFTGIVSFLCLVSFLVVVIFQAYNNYSIVYMPDYVSWLVNGNLLYTTTFAVPVGTMDIPQSSE